MKIITQLLFFWAISLCASAEYGEVLPSFRYGFSANLSNCQIYTFWSGDEKYIQYVERLSDVYYRCTYFYNLGDQSLQLAFGLRKMEDRDDCVQIFDVLRHKENHRLRLYSRADGKVELLFNKSSYREYNASTLCEKSFALQLFNKTLKVLVGRIAAWIAAPKIFHENGQVSMRLSCGQGEIVSVLNPHKRTVAELMNQYLRLAGVSAHVAALRAESCCIRYQSKCGHEEVLSELIANVIYQNLRVNYSLGHQQLSVDTHYGKLDDDPRARNLLTLTFTDDRMRVVKTYGVYSFFKRSKFAPTELGIYYKFLSDKGERQTSAVGAWPAEGREYSNAVWEPILNKDELELRCVMSNNIALYAKLDVQQGKLRFNVYNAKGGVYVGTAFAFDGAGAIKAPPQKSLLSNNPVSLPVSIAIGAPGLCKTKTVYMGSDAGGNVQKFDIDASDNSGALQFICALILPGRPEKLNMYYSSSVSGHFRLMDIWCGQSVDDKNPCLSITLEKGGESSIKAETRDILAQGNGERGERFLALSITPIDTIFLKWKKDDAILSISSKTRGVMQLVGNIVLQGRQYVYRPDKSLSIDPKFLRDFSVVISRFGEKGRRVNRCVDFSSGGVRFRRSEGVNVDSTQVGVFCNVKNLSTNRALNYLLKFDAENVLRYVYYSTSDAGAIVEKYGDLRWNQGRNALESREYYDWCGKPLQNDVDIFTQYFSYTPKYHFQALITEPLSFQSVNPTNMVISSASGQVVSIGVPVVKSRPDKINRLYALLETKSLPARVARSAGAGATPKAAQICEISDVFLHAMPMDTQ